MLRDWEWFAAGLFREWLAQGTAGEMMAYEAARWCREAWIRSQLWVFADEAAYDAMQQVPN